jgi:PAS domain S-box-containing protein
MSRSAPPGVRPADLLPELHRRLLEATNGIRSVLLRQSSTGDYKALSGRGFAELGDVWLTGDEAAGLDSLTVGGAPRTTAREALPSLVDRLGAPYALLMPVRPARIRTVLAVGIEENTHSLADRAATVATGFAAALEMAALEREIRLHRRLRELLLLFSRGISSTLNLATALETVAIEITQMVGASAATVWLHDRRARELELTASSEPSVTGGARVSTDDATHPAARGLRLDRPEVVDGVLLAPLRAWRRALGALVLTGVDSGELDEAQLVEFAYELGHQLSVGIENVQLLEEILRQRRLLEDTFNSLVDLVVVTDRDSRIVQVNDAFASRVGVPRVETIGRPLRELVGEDTALWVETADPAPGPPPEGTRPIEDARLGGTFLLTATPLINQDAQTIGRVLVARDITRQTRLEREREGLRARLAQSEKLASLGQFVAGIAHEMNNPLQGVLGHLELLIDTSASAAPVRRELRQIYLDADRAAKIVRNLLVFTGSHRMVRRRIQLDRVVTRMLASRKATLARHGIEIHRTQGKDLPPVLVDPLLLHQALLNILINAEHALADPARPNRRIDITTDADAARERVCVVIRDTGPGIAPETLPMVFDPFFTTKEVGQGTGLGLAITYGIVQEHDGTITASNSADGGATFTVDLPAAEVVVK